MATLTSNYDLVKPISDDKADIAVVNNNMDVIDAALDMKVDKVAGKVLSSNDYTADDKAKLAGIQPEANKSNLIRGIAFFIGGTLKPEESAMSFLAPCDLVLLSVHLAVDVAPEGAQILLDINKNGTTVFSTQHNRPMIEDGSASGTSLPPDITSIKTGDKITLDIDQVGNFSPGSNLSVTVVCRESGGK